MILIYSAALRCAPQRDNWEMQTSSVMVDHERESVTRFASNEGGRIRARQTTLPVFAGLYAGLSMSWAYPDIDFVGCLTVQGTVWT